MASRIRVIGYQKMGIPERATSDCFIDKIQSSEFSEIVIHIKREI